MQPINFEGAKIIKSNGEENCMHIYAQPVVYKAPVQYIEADGSFNEEERDFVFWREMWMPSKKDIENIMVGSPIVLELHCAQLTPVGCYTFDENGTISQPEFDKQLTPE